MACYGESNRPCTGKSESVGESTIHGRCAGNGLYLFFFFVSVTTSIVHCCELLMSGKSGIERACSVIWWKGKKRDETHPATEHIIVLLCNNNSVTSQVIYVCWDQRLILHFNSSTV